MGERMRTGVPLVVPTLRLLVIALAGTLAVSLPLLNDQQHMAVIAALTAAVLGAGVGIGALGLPVPQLSGVRLRTGHRMAATPSWVVTQVPRTPARPRAPVRH